MLPAMRTSFFTLLFLFQLPFLFGQGNFEITTVIPSRGGDVPEVGQFERLEYGIALPKPLQNKIRGFLKEGVGVNPYDPDQLDVEAQFTSPEGTTVKQFGFYFEEIKNTGTRFENLKTRHPIRIRFAPTSMGEWTVEIKVKVNNTIDLPTQTRKFNCIASDNKGYIVRGHDQTLSDRYLRYSKSGETFFAIGENMNWPSGAFSPKSRSQYDKLMPELAEAGGNFMRVGMMSWSYAIEWEQLGSYQSRQNQMAELDHIFFQAENLGIHIVLHMMIHDQYRPEAWKGDVNSWPYNPYNKELETVTEPIDFFHKEEAKKQYAKTLRYIMARWGYSTSLGVYELFSELDGAVEEYNDMGHEMVIVNEWFREIRGLIKEQYPEALVTGSFAKGEATGGPRKIFPDADVAFGHQYGRDEDINYNLRWKLARYLNTRYKTINYPYLLEEMGGGVVGVVDECSDVTFHNALWATSFSGGFGCGMNWWWDEIHKKGYQSNFTAVKNYFQGEDLVNFQYNTQRWRNKKVENFMLVEENKDVVKGWVHNRSFWWPNMYEKNPCIKQMIDDNNGHFLDPNDNTRYAKWRDKGVPTPLTGQKMVIKKLNRSMPWSPKYYKVAFYSTQGDGGYIKGKDVVVKTNLWGTLKVALPDLDSNNPDYGYKIERTDNP